MPLYDFECKQCHTVFEGICKSDEHSAICPKCGSKKVNRKIGIPVVRKNAGTSRII